ncbi:MAG: PTS mannitol-specific transporter subunit IIBC [Peptostreptococcaceae bacterium]
MNGKVKEVDETKKDFDLKASIQKFGKFLSGMVMPNIGAFIAWGLITAFFIETGWFPNEDLAGLVSPMLTYLLPILIGYTGGKCIADLRGGVIGAIATTGVIVGADIPMFIGAMAMGPLAGFVIKKFDEFVDGKVPTGFEMLVNNFSVGILGMLLAILGFYGVGPLVVSLTEIIEIGVGTIVSYGLLPLISIFIEPAKVLFLNNAINHGILGPIGIAEAQETGKSIMFLLESNPGPGLGIILAYIICGKGSAKESAPGAAIIHFLGGIHEIYFPYILMNPVLIVAAILGGGVGVLVFSILGAGIVAAPSPGSIFALMALSPRGGMLPILLGVLASTVVSFMVAAPIIKKASLGDDDTSLEDATKKMKDMKVKKSEESKGVNYSNVKKIVFSCDAGMGSSAMGASRFKNRIKDLDLGIEVVNSSVDNIPSDADIVVTHITLVERVKKDVEVISISNFLKDTNLDLLFENLTKIKDDNGTQMENKDNKKINKIVFSCDAGMGSSAMGASRFKNRIKDLNLGIEVVNSSVDNIPSDADIVVTHVTLVERVKGDVEVISISNFLKDANIDLLFDRVSK